MNVLGISCFYHDASAALLQDGKLVAAVEEERFVRKKHCTDFPKGSIDYGLKQGGITINDVDYIGFYEKLAILLRDLPRRAVERRWVWLFGPFVLVMAAWFARPYKIAAFFEYATSQSQQVSLFSLENRFITCAA